MTNAHLSAPTAASTTETCLAYANITPYDLSTYLTTTNTDVAGWSTIAFPTVLGGTTLAPYLASSSYYTQAMGAFSYDLSTFFTYCYTADACQYAAYSYRYDGLALGHYLDLVRVTAGTIVPASSSADFEAFTIVCDGSTLICWGWSLTGTYHSGGTSSNSFVYSSSFLSGVGYVDLSTTLPTAANFSAYLMANLHDVEDTMYEGAFGFSDVYWMGSDSSSSWPKASLAYRF
jgi:hypothetical protein